MSEISTAFDAPWIEPVEGFGDVKFALADCDYWGAWADQVKKQRIAADKQRLEKVPMVDPLRKAAAERDIEDKPQYLGEVIDRQHTSDGLKKIIIDSVTRGGRTSADAELIRKRIGIGRQMQLAKIICSEPMPTIDQYRESVRKMCANRGMSPTQIAQLNDTDLIRLAADALPPQTIEKQDGADPLSSGAESQTDTPESTGT